MKTLFLLFSIVSLVITTVSFAEDKVASPDSDNPHKTGLVFADEMTDGQYLQLVEHESCSELRLKRPSDTQGWSLSRGGGVNLSDPSWAPARQGLIDSVRFGKGDQMITLKLTGRNLFPQSIRETDRGVGFESQTLIDDPSHTAFGKMLVITDDLGPPQFQDGNNRHSKLLAAIMYINPKPGTTALETPCEFVKGPLNIKAMESGKCFWLDSSSRTTSGKPYCW